MVHAMQTLIAVRGEGAEMIEVGNNIAHWNYGTGTVLKLPRAPDDVPVEWQHDWQNVVMAQFWYLNNACIWVLAADLERE